MKKLKWKNKVMRTIAAFLLVTILTQVLFPAVSYALTSGPSQPEIQSFEPVGTTEMVDMFSGDFTYNIPLFELPGPNGGYPFNLFYNSGITMDQEASWVGLGWNLNPGAIVRQMRGFPDEYNNAQVLREMDMRPNVTIGVAGGIGGEIFGGGAQGNIGLGVYYNNYKGVGYSIDAGLNIAMSSSKDGSSGAGLDLKLDSQEGIGVDASLSLKSKGEHNTTSFNLGVGYNSREGLSKMSLGVSMQSNDRLGKGGKNKHGEDGKWSAKKGARGATIGGSSSLSFSSGGYSPQVSLPMQGRNVSLLFKGGVGVFGAFINGYISGFFSTQYLRDRKKSVSAPAYGYLNMHNAGSNALTDFNREKDGTIRKTSPNLPIPITTPDIYSLNGQGIGGMFRGYRNETGVLFDQQVKSTFAGGSLGVDMGSPPSPHIGVDASINYSTSESSRWEETDNNASRFGRTTAQKNDAYGLYEPSYFKVHGEYTVDPANDLDYILGSDAVRVELDPKGAITDATNKLEKLTGQGTREYTTYDASSLTARESRNTAISYIEKSNPSAGIVATNPDGTRYVYSKISNNTEHIECQFTCGPLDDICSANKVIDYNSEKPDRPRYNFPYTEQYFSRTSMPTYPYTYLIEYILGADYIDMDDNGIPSEGDFGYWVKFNYGTKITDYKWRAPFSGSSVIQGLNSTAEDNKGTYMYGTKEIQYLESAETKTHKAFFTLSERLDARGALSELQDFTDSKLGAKMMKLDKIELKAKSDLSKVIKTVNFQYNYKLCKGVENNGDAVNTGKLTLERVWFTYENNNRGRLSPYIFNYHEDNATYPNENPNYSTYDYDRWGNYKPVADKCKGLNLPYTDQFNKSNPSDATFRSTMDKQMSVWNLKEITLPSGGTIKVDYEADDYAYVQDKQAMQMFEIASLAPGNFKSEYIFHEKWADGNPNRKVYFKLQEPTFTASDILNYTDGIDKVFFKVFMKIRSSGDAPEDYVSGYVDIEDKGMDDKSLDANGRFTRGWIQLGRPRIGMKHRSRSSPYHPFTAAAFQY